MKVVGRTRGWGGAAGLCGVVGVVGLMGIGMLACPEPKPDRRAELLADLVDAELVELGQARVAAKGLDARVTELCASPDASHLDAAQDAWMQARAPWKRLLAVPVGPIVDEGFDVAIDFWPARPSSIEGGIAAGVTTQAELDALGVASKGFPAIEYLLWDPVDGDAAVLTALTGADGPARCAYVSLLAGDVALRLTELEALWLDGYAEQLDATVSSGAYPDLAVAIDAVVNAMIAGLHDIDDHKLGDPLGAGSTTGPAPDLVESRFSDRSRVDAQDGLEGFVRAYLGVDGGAGLTILVAQASPEIDANLRAAIEVAQAALAAVPEPLRESVSTDPDAVAAAEDAIVQLRMILSVDVAGLLGVTVSLSDNDGD